MTGCGILKIPPAMHFDAFDRYHEKDSYLHRLDPRVKALVTAIFIVSNSLLPDGGWTAFIVAWMFVIALNQLSKLGMGFSFKRSIIALPFAFIAVTVLFSIPGRQIYQLTFLKADLAITDAGLLRFASILIRSWLSVQMAILLVAVTRFPDLIHALEHLKVPALLTTIIAFLYRYLFVLIDEVFRLIRARESRSAALPGRGAGGGIFWRAKVSGNMTGQLFLRSYERSDRIYHSMLSRGYTGHFYTLNPHEMKRDDYFATAAAVVVIFIIQIVGRF